MLLDGAFWLARRKWQLTHPSSEHNAGDNGKLRQLTTWISVHLYRARSGARLP
jgi:hypothetical protein